MLTPILQKGIKVFYQEQKQIHAFPLSNVLFSDLRRFEFTPMVLSFALGMMIPFVNVAVVGGTIIYLSEKDDEKKRKKAPVI